MKVALVSDCFWPRINGVTISIQTFRDELERQGHETLVLAPAYPKASPDPEWPRVRRFRSTRNLLSKEDRDVLADSFPEIFIALDEFNPDIVHFNTEFGMLLAGSLWCKLHRKPVFITCHTNWEFYLKHYAPLLPAMFARAITRHYMLRAYLNADYILTPGSQMQELLTSYGVKGPFHVLQTGIDPAGFQATPEELLAFRLNLDNQAPQLAGKRLLLYVGRMGNEKNIAFLLPVLKLIRVSVPDTALVLIGDGPYRKKILKEAELEGLGDLIHAPGYMDRKDLRLAYGSADVFVFPSKTETQGLTPIEAMMCGTPVVAIGEMGTRDVMQGDNGGFMVPDDKQAFSEAVIRLLSDRSLQAEKSAEARAWGARFSVERSTKTLLGHYTKCLDTFKKHA
jgi:glycosyltransferase involved in cell wall biosynthesis